MTTTSKLEEGNAALAAGRWSAALAAFQAALKEGETPDALFGVGEALWWLGDTRGAVDDYERAYAGFRRADDPERAAWAAFWLAVTYGADFGNEAAYRGWIARAERVLEHVPIGPIHGWVWLGRAYDPSDLVASRELTQRVIDLAREAGDRDLELCALAHLGEVLVGLTSVEEGMALVDEAMAGTFGGERNRLNTVVMTSCAMLTACDLTADVGRATQWCRIAEAFIRKYGSPFLHARCRAGYGGILAATGHWAQAERELHAALRMTQGAYPPVRADALTRLAELRIAQGRLEEAEGLLAEVQDEVFCALPLAKLRLARCEPAIAIALLQRRLNLLNDDTGIETTKTLDVLVDAYLSAGDMESAETSAERLGALAERHRHDLITARALSGSGRVSAARGDTETAVKQMERALDAFSRLQLPWEAARVRLDLARALAPARRDVAVAEAQRALAVFDQIGATTDANAAAAFLRSLGVAGRTGPKDVGVLSQREQEVLGLIGLGFSNPEIAERLYISRKTAAHHVSSVLAKLGLRNRAEAVAYATTRLYSAGRETGANRPAAQTGQQSGLTPRTYT